MLAEREKMTENITEKSCFKKVCEISLIFINMYYNVGDRKTGAE